MKSDEDTIFEVLSGGDRLTLAELQWKSRLAIERVREAIVALERAGRIRNHPNPTARWKQTWSRVSG